ncbi:MAG: DUF2637 domain-containing protein [Gammaproteobacteria bacterium]
MPQRADNTIRGATAFSVAVVSLIAAVISYSHIYRVAIDHGQTTLDARLLPFSVDGLIAAASLTLFYASRNRLPSPGLARWMLGLGVGATIAVNSIYGEHNGPLGIVLSAWPAVAFIGAAELCIYMVRAATSVRSGTRARKAGAVRQWARFNGYQVSERGRIPDEISAAYQQANGSDTVERLTADDILPHESWEEYAEHSLTHDDLTPVAVSNNGDGSIDARLSRRPARLSS